MADQVRPVHWVRGVVGGAVGGAVGYAAMAFVARFGLYALVLPGALLGLGCGMLSGVCSQALGVACGVAALLLGVLVEWHTSPFVADESLAFFLTHIHQVNPMSLLMIVLGGVCGYSLGKGRERAYHFSGETVE